MENLPATLNAFRIENEIFTHIGDLEWFEGPLVSLFLEDTSAQLFILHWIDVRDDTHRWLLYPVSPRGLQLYLNGKITNEDLLWLQPVGMLRIVDMNADMQLRGVKYSSVADLPADYLPTAESYFDADSCPNLPRISRFLANLPNQPRLVGNYANLEESAAVARQVAEGRMPKK